MEPRDPLQRLPALAPPLDPAVGAAVDEAAVPLRAPGQGDRRVLSPVTVRELAERFSLPRWEVEATALEREVVPLRCLKQVARFDLPGQARLLRGAVALVGAGPPLTQAAERLARAGIGRLTIFTLADRSDRSDQSDPLTHAAAAVAAACNVNASAEVSSGGLALRDGDPVAALRGHDVCAAALEEMADETLLQAACRRLEIPLLLAGVDGQRGQATAILPGDPGVGLVYRPAHPHLERSRPGSLAAAGSRPALMLGSWLEQQVVAALLGREELLRDQLLYADMDAGVIDTHPLR